MTSTWYLNSINKTFDPNIQIEYDTLYNSDSTDFELEADTLNYGSVTTDTLSGFKTLNQYNLSIAMNTQVFFTYLSRNSNAKLRGLRYIMKPSISFGYTPDYAQLGYVQEVQQDVRDEIPFETYSIFEGGIFGAGPTVPGQRMTISYSINNILEAKVFSKRDSTEKKVKLLKNLSVSGSYSLNTSPGASDFRWSRITMSGNTNIIKGISRLTFGAAWDPYTMEDGRRVNKFYLKETGKLLRFEMASIRLSNTLSIGQLKEIFKGEGIQGRASSRSQRENDNQIESLTDIFNDFRIQHDLVMNWRSVDGKIERNTQINTINTSGNIPLSPKWNIHVGSFGYDFTRKKITYPYFGINRDLHCWNMGFNWAPERGTYNFSIKVSQAPLDFIKIPYQKNSQDVLFR